jgi:hypothetical protein
MLLTIYTLAPANCGFYAMCFVATKKPTKTTGTLKGVTKG